MTKSPSPINPSYPLSRMTAMNASSIWNIMQTWEVAEEREDTLEEEVVEASVVSVSASTTSQQGRNSIQLQFNKS